MLLYNVKRGGWQQSADTAIIFYLLSFLIFLFLQAPMPYDILFLPCLIVRRFVLNFWLYGILFLPCLVVWHLKCSFKWRCCCHCFCYFNRVYRKNSQQIHTAQTRRKREPQSNWVALVEELPLEIHEFIAWGWRNGTLLRSCFNDSRKKGSHRKNVYYVAKKNQSVGIRYNI